MIEPRKSIVRGVRLIALALVFGMFSSAGMIGVNAQDATAVCEAPAFDADAIRTPADVDTDATATAADEATTSQILDAVQNYFACFNQNTATSDTELYPFTTATLLNSDNPQIWSNGQLSADVQVMIGDHWFNEWRWYLTDDNGALASVGHSPLLPHPDVDFVSVEGVHIADASDDTEAFSPSSGSWDLNQIDAIIVNISNDATDARDIAIVQLPDDADLAELDLTQATFIALATGIEPGTSSDVVLVDLQPGTYTLVDLTTNTAQQFAIVPVEG